MIGRIQRQAVVAIIRMSNKFLFVKREVMEEIGLEVTPLERIRGITSHDNNSFLNYWTVNVNSGEATITSNEAIDLRWVTIEELKLFNPVFEEDVQIFERLTYDL